MKLFILIIGGKRKGRIKNPDGKVEHPCKRTLYIFFTFISRYLYSGYNKSLFTGMAYLLRDCVDTPLMLLERKILNTP